MDTAHLALAKGITVLVNGLPIHIPRQPVSRKVKREWKRLLQHAMRTADAGVVSPMGCVIPPHPRGGSREWNRWYRYAHRKSTPVHTIRRPALNELPPPSHEDILRAMALISEGRDPAYIKQAMRLTTAQLKVLLKAVRKSGREILSAKYTTIMQRIHSLRAQDMEIASM